MSGASAETYEWVSGLSSGRLLVRTRWSDYARKVVRERRVVGSVPGRSSESRPWVWWSASQSGRGPRGSSATEAGALGLVLECRV